MRLLVLIVASVVVLVVVTSVTRWWSGYRQRHNVLLQVVALTAVAFVVMWASQSSTAARVGDVALDAVLVLAVVAVAALMVAGGRRVESREAVMSQAAAASRPSARRSGHGRWRVEEDDRGREVVVYAIGAFDKRSDELRAIKIGSTARGEGVREAEVEEQQLGRMNTARRLGRGPGGQRREERMLARLDQWRYERSEWFEPSREVLSAVSELELTREGRELIQETATRRA